MTERCGERTDERFHRSVAVRLDVALHLAKERLHGAATILRQLAADEVEALDAVRTLIDHRDARIAYELLHAVLSDVAVPAKDLLRQHGVGEALVGEHAFDNRRKQAHVVI